MFITGSAVATHSLVYRCRLFTKRKGRILRYKHNILLVKIECTFGLGRCFPEWGVKHVLKLYRENVCNSFALVVVLM